VLFCVARWLADPAEYRALLVDLFLDAHQRAPREIVLDLDNTDIPLHGAQEHALCGASGLFNRHPSLTPSQR
jgi:hypothetical protein